MAEVDDQADPNAGRAQIIHDLRPVFIGQSAHGLELDNYCAETNEIRPVGLPQGPPLVTQANLFLGQKLNALTGQLQFQALLIYRLNEPTPLFLIDLKTRSENPMRFRL